MDGVGSLGRHFICLARDITERKAAEEKLVLAGRVFSHAREGISITDAHGLILDVNTSLPASLAIRGKKLLVRTPAC